MNEEQKQQYQEKYKRAKQNGEKFYPDTIYKDLVVSFSIFLLLIGLAIFLGVTPEPKANPSDAAYIPRPEWYFLFLFEMLKFFPGNLEWIGTTVIPGLAVVVLLLLPFLDRNPARHWSHRKLAIGIMSVIVIGMVALTVRAVLTTPPQDNEGAVATTLPAQIVSGQDLYSIECAQCHGADGEGGVIQGVKGLEGFNMKAIHSDDEMFTRNDESLASIVSYGQQNLGMPPFGGAYGGKLSPNDVENIVLFMRYTWDTRVEMPKEVAQAGAIPVLGPNDVPSYEAVIAPIVKRYCVSCHRSGKDNHNYLMDTYDDVMKSGDNSPNVVPGDLNSNLIRMLHREKIQAGGAMPPTKALNANLINLIERWVKAGAPQKTTK